MTADGPALEAYLSGAISAPDAAANERLQQLLKLARQHRDGLGLLKRMVQAGAVHGSEADPAMAIVA